MNSTIQQMGAFTEMLENVSKMIDEFMADNISDDQARDWLARAQAGEDEAADRGVCTEGSR